MSRYVYNYTNYKRSFQIFYFIFLHMFLCCLREGGLVTGWSTWGLFNWLCKIVLLLWTNAVCPLGLIQTSSNCKQTYYRKHISHYIYINNSSTSKVLLKRKRCETIYSVVSVLQMTFRLLRSSKQKTNNKLSLGVKITYNEGCCHVTYCSRHKGMNLKAWNHTTLAF